MSIFDRFHYIVVEGPIGSGKTTLANKLADMFPVNLLLENAGANPFLPKFYQDAPRYALPTQMFFLFQRVEQIRDLIQRDMFNQATIADFFLEKDPLFAQMNLNDEEYALYRQMYKHLHVQVPTPDLVIYLQSPVETLHERVNQRGNAYEQEIPREYLARLSDAYSDFFHRYDGAPVLIVNNEKLDITEKQGAIQMLLDRIMQMRSRREFFNPNLE
ncbi:MULTISPECIES: deoxynucleoside kinase [Methylobacillus]|uniref:Deoxynucleoside kinase n=1 Tax=Methylobacillus flagellatus (strain ATCC 51484 / DSM 6875 / VKM B-1610 / KT) TaxID=265072 RepID=Q1H3R9_METFK|nr:MULTISPECIES: deoxynucleoside kinase [Methylobacillus]ABE48868.1 deoxynucleoside kinase [Methylobacillus flagellatus KT]MPS49502.1 deoxynucleoside kinase [Methylobacillus sp.]